MPDLSELKAPIALVTIFTVLGCLGGITGGYVMGRYNPAYYRAVFPEVQLQRLDEVAVGVGLGATQGSAAGLVAGVVLAVVLMVVRSRRTPAPSEE